MKISLAFLMGSCDAQGSMRRANPIPSRPAKAPPGSLKLSPAPHAGRGFLFMGLVTSPRVSPITQKPLALVGKNHSGHKSNLGEESVVGVPINLPEYRPAPSIPIRNISVSWKVGAPMSIPVKAVRLISASARKDGLIFNNNPRSEASK